MDIELNEQDVSDAASEPDMRSDSDRTSQSVYHFSEELNSRDVKSWGPARTCQYLEYPEIERQNDAHFPVMGELFTVRERRGKSIASVPNPHSQVSIVTGLLDPSYFPRQVLFGDGMCSAV